MKKNGFTLIELLGVIVVISMIALITVPNIMGIIFSSKKKIYIENETRLAHLADVYMARKLIPYPTGSEKITITLTDLQSLNLIGDINDINGKGTCNGYVDITYVNGNNVIKAYIDCGSSYVTPGYVK